MQFRTHLLAAIIVAFLIIQNGNIPNPILFFIIFCSATLLPDIDLPESKLGKKIWPFSLIINIFFGHRGILHSIFIPLAFVIIGYIVNLPWIGIALAGGYIVHLCMDMLTPSGIRFLGIGKPVRGFIKTGGALEIVFFFALLLIFIFIVLKII